MLASFFFAAFFLSSPVFAMSEFRKNLENSFDELGVSYDDVVLQKCLEICKKYDITDAEEFVDSWMAYTVSHLQGANPTLGNLSKFEREEFAKKAKDSKKLGDVVPKKSLMVYEANKDMDIDEASGIIMAYNETTPRRNYSNNDATPDGSGIKRSRNYGSSPQAAFSPAGFSPTIATPSSNYVSRKNSGNIVCKFNDTEPNRCWKAQDNYVAKVEYRFSSNIQRYMCYDLVDCLEYADATIEKLGDLICSKYSFEDLVPIRYKHPTEAPDLFPAHGLEMLVTSQSAPFNVLIIPTLAHCSLLRGQRAEDFESPFVTLGRIACDADGRLNSKSVLLEGSSENGCGGSVSLDLSGLGKYSFFPGQVVAVEGQNLTGEKLFAKNVYSDVCPDAPQLYQLPRGSLNVMVAAGPFTPTDSMTYQPLLDLVEEVVKDEPHILILTGPLIDSNHPVILENTLAETFEDLLVKLIDKIMKPLEKKKTQVVIVNSYKDCSSQCVYPTPALTLKARSYPKLHLLQDPSVFTVEDVVFGVTSTDILFHLSKEEISSCFGSGRLPRLASHILSQRSFYPLNPATEVPLDPTLMDHAKLDFTPHVLILPSDLRYFITEVNGCVIINPEKLAKGVIGGSFARILISKNEVVANICKI